jgi:hypothetical protein
MSDLKVTRQHPKQSYLSPKRTRQPPKSNDYTVRLAAAQPTAMLPEGLRQPGRCHLTMQPGRCHLTIR